MGFYYLQNQTFLMHDITNSKFRYWYITHTLLHPFCMCNMPCNISHIHRGSMVLIFDQLLHTSKQPASFERLMLKTMYTNLSSSRWPAPWHLSSHRRPRNTAKSIQIVHEHPNHKIPMEIQHRLCLNTPCLCTWLRVNWIDLSNQQRKCKLLIGHIVCLLYLN